MQAVVSTRYGPPETLTLQEIEKPVPNDDQVLVQVRALSLNPAEAHLRSGILLARVMTGAPFKPKDPIPGADFAGRIEAAGKRVTQFKPGDEVFGRRSPGGFAEYLTVSERPIALKPASASFEQAAAVPTAALTALQSLRDVGQVQAGQKVLVNGAAGGVGTFTVQLAKVFGTEVAGVTSTRNLELVRSLGADEVIDYTRQDFTRSGQQYDLIIDNVGNHTAAALARALRPNGLCVGVGFTSIGLLLNRAVTAPWVARTTGKRLTSMLARIGKADLAFMAELMEAGRVMPVIDKRYPLSQVAEAFRYLETKHASGKIIITV